MKWWQQAVFYQIYPRSFMDSTGNGLGDIRGIISRLDYLNDGTPNSLGVDAIWFSPFFPSPQKDFGYDVADYCNIAPEYGTLADFDDLIREAHKRGIRVMLDLVVNHTSDQHPWFLESRSAKDNPKRDWYIWRDGKGPKNAPPNNWRSIFSGSAWEWDEHTGQYYLHSFLREQADLNWTNPEVQEAIHQVIRFWLDRGADGYRLDVAHAYCKDQEFRDNPPFFKRPRPLDPRRLKYKNLYSRAIAALGLPDFQAKIFSQNRPETHDILKGFRKVLDEYPQSVSIGEVFADYPDMAASYYGSNDELHMNFCFDFLESPFKAEAFRYAVEEWLKLLPPGAWPAWTLSNHDQVRAISRYGIKGREEEQAKLLAMLLLTLPGTPFIYYGEEIGMKDPKLPKHLIQDPVGKKLWPFHKGRDSQRTPMQWDSSPGAGFTAGVPWLPVGPELARRNVVAQAQESDSLLNFYRRLIWLRKEQPALLSGTYTSLNSPGDCYIFTRETGEGKLLVALNFSTRPQQVSMKGEVLLSTHKELSHSRLLPLEGRLVKLK